MSNKTVVTSFPVLGLLGVALVVLKLIGTISWSWWWVLAPFWAPWVIALFVVGSVLLVALAARK